MRKQPLLSLFLLAIALPLLLIACRREEPTPTVLPTAVVPEATKPAQATPTRAATATATATAAPTETVVEPIDPASIDWAPQVVYSSPQPGQESLLDGAITVRFDQPMDESTVEDAFAINPAGGTGPVTGQFSWPNADTVVFTPQGSLERNQAYDVRIASAARGRNGKNLDSDVELRFQTVGFLEVTQVIPADGVGDVETDSSLTVFFNRPVVPLVSTAQQDELPDPLQITPDLAGDGEWVSTSIYRFTPDEPLAAATEYRVTVPAGLQDVTGGLLADDFTWSFTTTRPSVATIIPGTGTTDVIPTEPMTVTFSAPMDRASTEGAISLAPAAPLQFEWSADSRTVKLLPQTRLELGTRYNLTVAASALAARGQASLDRETSSVFTTIPLPGIENTTPGAGDEAPAYLSGISIQFVSPMDRDSIDERIQISPTPDDPTYWISPDGRYVSIDFVLQRNTSYRVTIPGDVADPYGNTLGADYTWNFRTQPLAPLASLNLPPNLSQLSTSFASNVGVIHRNISSFDAALFDVGLPVNLLLEPGRTNDMDLPGNPLRTWSQPVSSPLDTAAEFTLDLGGGETLPTGVYLLTVDAPEVNRDNRWWQNMQNLLVVADTNLVVKEMFGEVHVWATDLADGAPLPDQPLTLYDSDGNQVGSATTNGDGFASFDYSPTRDFLPGVLVVSGGPGEAGFGVSSSIWQGGLSPWSFNVPATTSDEQPERAYIYTDRPIYRPGDTVYYRGIIRDEDYARYTLPQRTAVDLRVEFFSFFEPSQPLDYSASLPVDANGTFDGSFVIPEDADLGQYRLFIMEEGLIANASRNFTVAQYRKPEFQVSVTPAVTQTVRGDTVDVTVEARYFFGAPATDLAVQWTVRSLAYSPAYEGHYYSFSANDTYYFDYGDQANYFGNYITDGSGRTDGDGRLVITLPADLLVDVEAGSRIVTVEATVSDISEFPVTANGQVIFHAADLYAGISPQTYLATAETETAVDILTVDWSAEPVPNQDVEVVFYERDYEYVPDERFGATYGTWQANDTEVSRVQVTTDSNGEAEASFVPANGGTFRAVATVTDDAGRTQSSSTLFWVSSADFVTWRQNPDEKRMDLTPEQRSYDVGETARVLVQSPFAGPVQAWLTIERGTLLQQRLITLESNSEVIEIPVSEAFAPNIFVSVVAVKGTGDSSDPYADIRLGVTELVVPPQRFDLNVSLTPRDDLLAPGATVTYDISVTDYAGRPVQADLSLALVDLAVLTLAEDNAPPILDAFYERQPLRSQTGSGLFVSGEGRALEVPTELGGLGGGGGGGEAAQEAVRGLEEESGVRRDFPDTAFWRASLTTDASGQASIDIPLPDSVTTWRLSSKAVTSDTRVGQTSVDVVATLPLLVRPVTPRFFTVNDEVLVGAIVNNNTGGAFDATVSLEVDGLTLLDDATQQVDVPANGQRLVRWQVRAEDVSFADMTFRVEGGGYTDASKPTLGTGPNQVIPVYRYDAEDIAGTSGVLEEAGRSVEAVLLPPEVNTRSGSLDVTVSASLAGAIVEALDYTDLVDLETACAHAVVSQFLPNLATARAFRQLGLPQPAIATTLDDLVQRSINRLAQLQKSDGGWGWCDDAESDDFFTAYVLFGLVQAAVDSYDLGAIDTDAALRSISLTDPQDIGTAWEANREAWLLYALASWDAADTEALDALFSEHREILDPYARAYLILAYDALGATGSNNAQALRDDLADSAILSASGAHWEDADPDWRNLSSDIRGTAVVIDAFAQTDPNNGVAAQAVRWLMSARTAGHWTTPFETTWSVLALTDWMVVTGELQADYSYNVSVNGRSLVSGSFGEDNVTASETNSVPTRSLLTDDVNFLFFSREDGPGRLYYTTHLDAFVNAESVDAVDRGFTIERTYYDDACDPDETTCTPLTSITAGQRVRVELTITTPNDRSYVRVEDPLPAGAEAVDPGLSTSASGLGGGIERDNYRFGYWGWWYFNRIEYRDDRVVFLSTFLPAGTYQYTYYLETPIPGSYQLRPTVAYEEFFPDVFGRGAGMLFTIEE